MDCRAPCRVIATLKFANLSLASAGSSMAGNQLRRNKETVVPRNIYAIPMIAAASLLGACSTSGVHTDSPPQITQALDMSITGQVTYSERIALQPGSVLDVQLLDVSLADAPSIMLVQDTRRLSGEQVPLSFSLTVNSHKLRPNMRYVVRATITDPSGHLAWTTDTVHQIDPAAMVQDMGALQLARVSP